MQRELVIARYREDLGWVSQFEDWKIHLYDKSEAASKSYNSESAAYINITPLPNIGREAHSYLTHIVNHYEQLADVTAFLQGNPHEHVQDLKSLLEHLPDATGYFELGHTPIADRADGNPSHTGLDIAGLYQTLFGTRPPEFYPFHAGANFVVSRATIRRRPREFYQRALDAVLVSRFGPWEIERLWPQIFQPPSTRSGIVTAATANVFFDLQQLLKSLEQFPRCPVEVFDLGLTSSQQRWIDAHPQRTLRALPRLANRVSRLQRTRDWPTWLKPFYLLHSRYDRGLWIDADCIVLRDPAKTFELIHARPLIMHDVSPAEVRNAPSLYRELPVKSVDPSTRLNAGVVGFDRYRDAEMLGAWSWAVQWAARNLRLRNWFRWFDQGALLWALQRLSQETVIESDLTWNTPWLTDENPIEQAAKQGISLSRFLQNQFPQAGIVHFLGCHKLSLQCQGLAADEVEKSGNLAGSAFHKEGNPS